MSQNIFTQEEMQLLNSIFTKMAAFFGAAALSLSNNQSNNQPYAQSQHLAPQPVTLQLLDAAPVSPKVKKSRPRLSEAKKTQRSPKTIRKPATEMTFRKNGIINAHISLLYYQLIDNGWLDSRTSEEDFLALFEGSRNDCRIIWSGRFGKGTLVYLFCQLIAEDLIDLDRGFTLAHILESHFVDTKGNPLTNLDHGDPFNNQAVPEVKDFIHTMKVSLGRRSNSIETENTQKSKSTKYYDSDYTDDYGYGDDYDPYDDQDLRLHNKHGRC